MKENQIVKLAVYGVIAYLAAPIVINGTLAAVSLVANGIDKIKFNQKIKKGLKDGSIVEIDGKYYEVTVDEA